MEYYSAIKRKKFKPKDIRLSEIRQTEKDQYCMVSLTCRISKKKKSNSQIRRVNWCC